MFNDLLKQKWVQEALKGQARHVSTTLAGVLVAAGYNMGLSESELLQYLEWGMYFVGLVMYMLGSAMSLVKNKNQVIDKEAAEQEIEKLKLEMGTLKGLRQEDFN